MIEVIDLMLRDMAVVCLGVIGLLCITAAWYCAAKVVKLVFDYCNGWFADKKEEPNHCMIHDPDFAIYADIIDSDQLKEYLRS